MSRNQPTEMWTVETGEYSDHRVLCVCRTKKQAEAIAAALNSNNKRWGDAFIGTLPVATDVNYVTTYTMQCEVWDDGTTTDTHEAMRTELDIDMLWPERAKPVGWRWVRAPMYNVFDALQKWEGRVLDIADSTFTAIVVDGMVSGVEEEVEFDLEEVTPGDLDLVVPGAVFYWSIGYRTEPSGERSRSSVLVFRRLPVWSEKEVQRTQLRVRELRHRLGW